MAIGDKQWLVTKPAGTDLISDIDGYQTDNNYALETILCNYWRIPSIYNSSDSEITISAGEVVCTDGSTYKMRANTTSITCEDASMDADSWYYIYAVADVADATTFTGELVKVGSAASGTNLKLISMCKTDGDGDIIAFHQTGRKYFYDEWQELAKGSVGYLAWASIDTSTYVPSALSDYCFGSYNPYATGGGNFEITNDNSLACNNYNLRNIIAAARAGSDSAVDATYWAFNILTANTLYWCSTSASHVVWIAGFEITKL